MKRILVALALAAAGLSPAAAQAPQAGAPVNAAVDHSAHQAMPAGSPTSPAAVAQQPGGLADPAGNSGAAPAKPASSPFASVAPTPGIGVPDGRKGLQEQVTDIGREAAAFHNGPLLWLCALISAFVLALLGYTMVRYRRSANPKPSRTSHNTLIEVLWTVVPVLILVAIAIPSIKLLRHQYSPPKADLTVKVIGNQWYWTYQYPDNGDLEIVSNMLKEQKDAKPGERFRTDADGPPLLAVDERMVIPVGAVVKFIVTSNDVIHAFAMPAFWQKMDANPGILNETWVKVDRPGVYFGQCSELCGARHAYMPIAIEVVPPAQFAAWIASKGGSMPGATPAPSADSTGSSPLSRAANPAVVSAAAPQPAAGIPSDAAPAKATSAPAPGVTNNR